MTADEVSFYETDNTDDNNYFTFNINKPGEKRFQKRNCKMILPKMDKDGIRVQPKLFKTSTVIPGMPDTCRKCGREFEDDHVLCQHLRWEHFEKDRGNVYHDVYGEVVKDLSVLEERARQQHRDYRKNRSKDAVARTFVCDSCPVKFKYDWTLAIHRKKVHGLQTVIDGKVIEAVGVNLQQDRYEKLPCDRCGLMITKIAMTKHILSKHDIEEKPYPCDQCDKVYVSCSQLFYHRRQVHSKLSSFICEHCGKSFNTPNGFKHHSLIHKGHRYQCKLCDAHFSSSSALVDHKVRVHEKKMKYQCEYCGRRFFVRGNMTKHIKRRHSDGVYHPIQFEINDKKDWSREGSVSNRKRPVYPESGNSFHKIPNVDLDESLLKLNNDSYFDEETVKKSSKTKTAKKTETRASSKSKKKKKDLSDEDANNSLTSCPNDSIQEILDFSHIEANYATTMIQVIPDNNSLDLQTLYNNNNHSKLQSHQTIQPAFYPSSQQNLHFLPNTTCQLNAFPSQSFFSMNYVPDNYMLSMEKKSTALISGECKLCEQLFPDIRSHYVDYHRIKQDSVQKLLSKQLHIVSL